MPRAKGSVAARRRHKKVLERTKGQRGTKHALYRRAHEAMLQSLRFATRDRRRRKRDMRRLWITRINAAARQNGMKYSTMMGGLNRANVEVNRKMLAEMAITDPTSFTRFVDIAQEALATEA